MKIPKVIHYCWFGGNEKSDLIKHCIESWKKNLPDYDIIEWNESNFDITINDYVREAYEYKKYAFVSDYVRLYAIYNYGGIYLDADVEVLKSLDGFLVYDGFTGYEDMYWAVTGTIGCVKNNEVIGRLLEYYKDRKFIVDGYFDLTTNTQSITNIFIKDYDLVPNGKEQELKNYNFRIFPMDYFCKNLSENTYTVHHFNASWY